MSKWIDDFQNHPFQVYWKQIVDLNNDIKADNIAVLTDVEEIARYRKTVSYINQLIQACDPELVPSSTWSNFLGQSKACLAQIDAYQQNRSITYIQNANQNLDNLLSYIAPFVKDGKTAAKASSTAFKEYEKLIKESLSVHTKEIENAVATAQENLDEIKSLNNKSRDFYTEFKEFNDEFFRKME